VDTPVLACRGGAERAFFSNLFFSATGARMGSGLVVDGVMDTTTLDHCLLWGVTGTGVRVARGSEVRIVGGRIIGATNPYQGIGAGSTGVHLAGGNGGVHILTTDIISLGTCLKIGEPGAVSNREVFITHATFDSSTHGLWQVDNAYTSIAGCWAASSDEDQILIDETSPGAILVVTGGTIFNGGAYGRPGAHNGIDIRAGSFVLSGTTVRHNKGTGIQVGENVHDYAITGCRILNNGTGVVLAGARYAFTGNVVAHNQTALVDHGGEDRVLQANVGIG
jgi:nitrous oxidase accessory protein NosD